MLTTTAKLWQELGTKAFIPGPTRLQHEAWAARYTAGETIEEIATSARVSPYTVRKVLKDLKIPRRLPGPRGPSKRAELRNQDIVALYQSGLTLDAVGRKHNLTRERVRQLLIANGCTPRTTATLNIARREAKDSDVKALFEQGCTTAAIATQLGISYSNVLVSYRRQGLRQPPVNRPSERTLKALQLFDGGASIREIATTLGYLNRRSLQALLHKHGRTIQRRLVAQAQKALADGGGERERVQS